MVTVWRWVVWVVWQSLVPPTFPNPAPGLTHVQRGGERVETSDWRRVLAAGQVQARATAEGTLGVGLRGACMVIPSAASLPAPAARP